MCGPRLYHLTDQARLRTFQCELSLKLAKEATWWDVFLMVRHGCIDLPIGMVDMNGAVGTIRTMGCHGLYWHATNAMPKRYTSVRSSRLEQ